MDCLDEETIFGFCRGEIADELRERAQQHIDHCEECGQLVTTLARSSFAESAPRETSPPRALDRESERNSAEPRPLLRGRPDPALAASSTGTAGQPPAFAVRPGDVLAGKFEVERILASGDTGIVVAARHRQLEQRVALKLLLPAAYEVPGAAARFLREGKAAARITSEHVARVMDTGTLSPGAPYFVMEYLEGTDLGTLVQQRGPLPAEEAIEYVLQACEAIAEAHGLGIVHRDLKPSHLFLAHRADGSPLVKVLDFGISKVSSSGSRTGSPRYMSPEQMMSAKDVDARTDVWALGVILYELVTGKPAWESGTMQGLRALIASGPSPRLREAAPNAPATLEAVIAHCLAKAVDDRVASVADLAEALQSVASDGARTSIARIARLSGRDRPAACSVRASAAAPGEGAPGAGRGVAVGIGIALLVAAGFAVWLAIR